MNAIKIRDTWRNLRAPRRAVRSRGFGIHSPFAFRFVRETLTQRYAYYCYPELTDAAKADSVSPRAVRALFRLALQFRPAPLTIHGDTTPAMSLAMNLGNPHPQGPGMARTCHVGLLRQGINETILLWTCSPTGMLFLDTEMAVFIESPHLPHQRFDIILP